MPSKTRARKLKEWPFAMIPDVAEDGTVTGISVKQVRPREMESGQCRSGLCFPVDRALLDAKPMDRHGRPRRKMRDGRIVIEDQPLTENEREAEIDARFDAEYPEEEQRKAVLVGAPGNLGEMRVRRAAIAVEVDNDINRRTT